MNSRTSLVRRIVILAVLSFVLLAGCGGGTSQSFNNPTPTPSRAPTITTISPNSVVAGSAALTLTINGTNFMATSTVNFGGTARTTTFVSSTQLTAAIPAAAIASTSTAAVTVTNPALAGGTSNAVDFTNTSGTSCDTNIFLWGGSTGGAGMTPNSSRFTNTGNMTQPRAGHTATLLHDSKVLVIDGGQLDIDDLLVSIVSAEIFDPLQGQFTPTGAPCIAREFHTATLLASGKVLIAGGNEFSNYPTWLPPTATAELYDPGTSTFAKTGSMATGRTYHTATLLGDGRVLVVGGSTNVGSASTITTEAVASAEIYDPATGTFSVAGNMGSPRAGHTATLLASGEVLVTGGQTDRGAVATAEVYDPRTNSFTATGSMAVPRAGHTATLLASGKVLVVGGATGSALLPGVISPTLAPEATAELFDPVTRVFVPTASMSTGRIAHTATLLGDGTVLIAGGYKDYVGAPTWLGYESFSSAEIYDPMAASFTATGPMSTTRFWHAATMLPDGTVLFSGGIGSDFALSSAEIYK